MSEVTVTVDGRDIRTLLQLHDFAAHCYDSGLGDEAEILGDGVDIVVSQ